MSETAGAARLFLVAPIGVGSDFSGVLAEALAAGDVAAVLVSPGGLDGATDLVPIIQAAGAAALVADDTRLVGRLRADGVHVGSGFGDLRLAVESLRPERIVGAANLNSRHTAMEAGEIGPDYVFFGRPHGDTHDEAHPRSLELASWWSELMDIPAVMMAGRSLGSVGQAAATGAGFIALHQAVWSHPDGPGAAVRLATSALQAYARRAG